MSAYLMGGVLSREKHLLARALIMLMKAYPCHIVLTSQSRFEFAKTDEEADTLWQNRKYALISTLGAHPGSRCWTTDVW